MSKIDLHIHTSASDGKFSPAEIINKAVELGMTTIAITDHDTADGIIPALEAASAFPRLTLIPGIEISTEVPRGEVHVLGYFIDYTDHKLKAILERFRNSRKERARKMIGKLSNLGIHIDWQRVQEIAGSGSIGRPHVAEAMLEKGYITSMKEAFDKYLSRDGPAYAERDKMTPADAVELVLQAKGLPVLAHPLTASDPEALVTELKAVGLIGLEAHYNGYTEEEINWLMSLAARYNIITTGGSDYHGIDIGTDTMIGGVDVPVESAEQLIALAEKQGQRLAL